jgi:hypothetical protein
MQSNLLAAQNADIIDNFKTDFLLKLDDSGTPEEDQLSPDNLKEGVTSQNHGNGTAYYGQVVKVLV